MTAMNKSSDSSSETLSIAVCQMTSTDDVAANLGQIQEILATLGDQPPALICFPENCLFMRVREGQAIAPFSVASPEILILSQWAQKFNSNLHLGSVPIERDGRLFNSTLLLRASGAIEDIYQKIHLFDVDVAGHKPVRESDVFAAGEKPTEFVIDGWRIGSTICYDLRFAELFSQYARSGVDAVIVPSAFLVPTGAEHWHVLLRARAIESQCYVLAAAQGGTHHGSSGGERHTYGHSLVVDPWGSVVAEVPDGGSGGPGAGVLRVNLARARIVTVRAQIPMQNHRRL